MKLILAIVALLFSGLAFANAQVEESILNQEPLVLDASSMQSSQFADGIDSEILNFELQEFNNQIAPQSRTERVERERRRRGRRNHYYDWGRGRNGWGYCYHWTRDGRVLNDGRPVSNHFCERRRPSYYNWGRGKNGWGYCYQWTPKGVAMNEGRPVSNYLCERRSRSYYQWGTGRNGKTYCYQWTPNGVAMNEGKPVAEHLCY